jgi:MEDS: MEthanogen/methylotroph, DcmR Sensory domain
MTGTIVAGRGLQLSNGDHVCVFCRGGERDELLVPFLADGLSAGDRCLAVVDTSEPEEVLDALGTGGGDGYQADQLTVLASRDVYLSERGFDMEGMLDFYGAELQGVAEGRSSYDRIRTAGEMTWALRDIPGVEDLLAYEARVNQVMAANPEAAAISLCVYDVERFDAELIVGCCARIPRRSSPGRSSTTPSTSSRRSSCGSGTTDPRLR